MAFDEILKEIPVYFFRQGFLFCKPSKRHVKVNGLSFVNQMIN
jgi:hypothetical protein